MEDIKKRLTKIEKSLQQSKQTLSKVADNSDSTDSLAVDATSRSITWFTRGKHDEKLKGDFHMLVVLYLRFLAEQSWNQQDSIENGDLMHESNVTEIFRLEQYCKQLVRQQTQIVKQLTTALGEVHLGITHNFDARIQYTTVTKNMTLYEVVRSVFITQTGPFKGAEQIKGARSITWTLPKRLRLNVHLLRVTDVYDLAGWNALAGDDLHIDNWNVTKMVRMSMNPIYINWDDVVNDARWDNESTWKVKIPSSDTFGEFLFTNLFAFALPFLGRRLSGVRAAIYDAVTAPVLATILSSLPDTDQERNVLIEGIIKQFKTSYSSIDTHEYVNLSSDEDNYYATISNYRNHLGLWGQEFAVTTDVTSVNKIAKKDTDYYDGPKYTTNSYILASRDVFYRTWQDIIVGEVFDSFGHPFMNGLSTTRTHNVTETFTWPYHDHDGDFYYNAISVNGVIYTYNVGDDTLIGKDFRVSP